MKNEIAIINFKMRHGLLITLSIVYISFGITTSSSNDVCHSDSCGQIGLKFVLDSEQIKQNNPNKIFFIETSGRDHLLPRQVCAIETALVYGKMRVFVVMNTDHLNLEANNSTKQLYTRFKGEQP